MISTCEYKCKNADASDNKAPVSYRRPVAGWVNSLKQKGKPAGIMILAKEGKTDYHILIPSSEQAKLLWKLEQMKGGK